MQLEVYALKLNFGRKIDYAVMDELMTKVEASKEVRLRRFVRQEDRLRGLFADLLIRDRIKQETGLDNECIDFCTNEYGKPFLRDVDLFHFNLSHSGDWVVCAIDEKPVGIDVEEIQEIDLDISKHYFSRQEHEDLMNRKDRIAHFFSLWSLKESYIKILGKGLSHPLNAFSIRFLESGEISIFVDGVKLDNIYLRQYDVDVNYKMGICAQHEQLPACVNLVIMEDLIRSFVPDYNIPLYRSPDHSVSSANTNFGYRFKSSY